MKDKLQAAIRNNIGLYEAVFRAQGIPFAHDNGVWYSPEEAPPLYSNLITTSRTWRPEHDDNLQRLTATFERERWEKISVKDSYNTLDLRDRGFEKLFEAQWLYLEAERLRYTPDDSSIVYDIVRDENTYSAWKARWDVNEREILAHRIFTPTLLANPDVRFVAGFREREIANGCIFNRTSDAIGMSNVFTTDPDPIHLAEMIVAIHRHLGSTDVICYGQHPEAFQQIGFETAGRLAVWIKRRRKTG